MAKPRGRVVDHHGESSRKQLAGERAWECWLGAVLGHQRGSLAHQRGFLDLVDRPLLAAILDPAGAAAGADGGRVQTKADRDQGRSAQRATWHKNLSDLSGLPWRGWWRHPPCQP